MVTVNILSNNINAPTNQHWLCGKSFLRCLQGPKCLINFYSKEASYDLLGEFYAACSGDVNNKKLLTGYYLKLIDRDTALSYGVKNIRT